MSFRYEFEMDQPEQVRASQVMHNRRWDTRALYAFFALAAVVGLALHLRSVLQGGRGWWSGVAVLVLAALGGSAGSYFTPHWLVRNLRKNNRAAAGPHVYSLSETGLEAVSTGARTTLEWQNVVEAYETYEFLLLYISKGFALILPKRVVRTEELPLLRQALRQWLGERAPKAPPARIGLRRRGSRV